MSEVGWKKFGGWMILFFQAIFSTIKYWNVKNKVFPIYSIYRLGSKSPDPGTSISPVRRYDDKAKVGTLIINTVTPPQILKINHMGRIPINQFFWFSVLFRSLKDHIIFLIFSIYKLKWSYHLIILVGYLLWYITSRNY